MLQNIKILTEEEKASILTGHDVFLSSDEVKKRNK